MATILTFSAPSRGARRPPLEGGSAEILFFTGVRYEREAVHPALIVPAKPRGSGGPQKGRKKRA